MERLLRESYKEITTVIAGNIVLKPLHLIGTVKQCDDIKKNFLERKTETKQQEPFNIHPFLTIVNIGYKVKGEQDAHGKLEAMHTKEIVPFFSRQSSVENIRQNQKSPQKLNSSPPRFVGWKSLKRKTKSPKKRKKGFSDEESAVNRTNIVSHEDSDLLDNHMMQWRSSFKKRKITPFARDEIVQKKLDDFNFYRFFCEKIPEKDEEPIFKRAKRNGENILLKTRNIIPRDKRRKRKGSQNISLKPRKPTLQVVQSERTNLTRRPRIAAPRKSFMGVMPLDFGLLTSERNAQNLRSQKDKIRYLSNPVNEMTEERVHRYILYDTVESRTKALTDR